MLEFNCHYRDFINFGQFVQKSTKRRMVFLQPVDTGLARLTTSNIDINLALNRAAWNIETRIANLNKMKKIMT